MKINLKHDFISLFVKPIVEFHRLALLERVAIVVGRKACPWCDKAKELLNSYNYNVTYISYEDSDFVKKFLTDNNLETVPQIFIGNELIGGYENVQRRLVNG
jgi:glutaredoxin